MKVAIPKYINTLPFRYPIEEKIIPSSIEFIKDTPTNNNQMLLDEKVDLALVSSYFFLQHENVLEKAGPFCITAENYVYSVLFFQKEASLKNKKPVFGVTEESATSIKLLELMCKNVWKIDALFTPFSSKMSLEELTKQFDGFLLIGDRALQTPFIPGFITHDLAALWQKTTKLPFVFALLAKRRGTDVPPTLEHELKQALLWSLSHIDTIVIEAEKITHLPKERLTAYFEALSYEMNELHEMSLSMFSTLTEENGCLA